MASVRPEIQWAPTLNDTFLTWSSNLHLYQTVNPDETVGCPKISLGEKYSAKLIIANSDYQYIKCVSWYFGGGSDFSKHLVAVGLANGKIAITNFTKQSDFNKVVGKEFVARNSRQVNSLAWNPTYHQFLVGGMDRASKDNSLVVIDILQGVIPATTYCYERPISSGSENLRCYLELCSGESVHSVEFSHHDPQIILAGVNNRQIKLFDMRIGKSITSINTKATCNIASDSLHTHRFASSHDNIVYIWDVRNLERSVLNLTDNSNKAISKLSWSPTRYGFLASLPRDCSTVRLYDIHRNEAHKDDHEPSFVTRSISIEPNNTLISSFSWHPTHENRITIASYSGQLRDHVVKERVMMDFSNRNTIGWSSVKGNMNLLDNQILEELESDISFLMKDRAIKNYGLQTDSLIDNGKIGDNPTLLNLWTWLEEGRRLSQNSFFKMPEGGPYRYQGVWSIVSESSKKAEIQIRQWTGVEGVSKSNHVKIFKSVERAVALMLCSWSFEGDTSVLINFTTQLELIGQYTRAAAIAVFNLNIPMAIKILQRGAERENKPALNTTAMALAGYTNERKALWRETCISLLKSISDPYIRSTFAFLTGESETFDVILRESSMTIQDRVAFACKYLSDVPLIDYLSSLKSDLVKSGNLNGIILTGLEQDGLDLIQQYIDTTGDIQTAAFVVVHSRIIEPNSRSSHWVEQYQNLLNNLQLWKERALMDVLKNSFNGNKIQKKFPPQIFVSCNFCLKSISVYVQAPGRSKNPYALYGKTSTQKSKMTSCPNCRKPLPRCSMCLQHMGTPSKRGTSKALSVEDETIDLKKDGEETEKKMLTNFSHWFTWCQACHHGGHAHHMMEWFKDYSECPVGACTCRCMEIDGFNRLGVSINK